MEGRTHPGLGSETAALQPWDEELSSAPVFRGLLQNQGSKAFPMARQVRGFSSYLEMGDP